MNSKAKKTILWTTIAGVGATAIVLPILLRPISTNFEVSPNQIEMQSRNMGPILEEIVPGSEKTRTPNNLVYSDDYGFITLKQKYGQYGFKYPSYKYRYNQKNPETDDWYSILHYQQDGVQKKLNCAQAIHKEEIFSYKSESLSETKVNNETRWASEGFVLDEIKYKRLKKHPAIIDMYRDMVSDDIPSITKRFVMTSSILGTNETGLYIPPGEIATLTFSDEMYNWIQENQDIPFQVVLNNNAWDGRVDNKGQANESYPMGNRYPFLRTSFGFWDGWKNALPVDPDNPSKKLFPRSVEIGSPFGGIINVYTRKKMIKELNGIKKNLDFKFEISGAVPTMHYIDSVTTEEEWYAMIEDVYNKKRAPFFTANTFFYSFAFPFGSNDNEPNKVLISDKDLKSFSYPRKTFRKWYDFLFSSWYYSTGDERQHRKIDMEFSDQADVWGGAGAWGGGDALYAAIGWGVFAFLSDVENWSYGGNWGVYHEINHNFQQDSALFKQHGHPETNEVTMAALAQLNDTLRARTEYDPLIGAGDWATLSNPYGLLQAINNNWWRGEEYGFYANLLYTFGPYNYMNYVRYDVANHWNTSKTWTGQSEIINLSNYYKLNLVNAIYDYIEKNIWPDFTKDVHTPTTAEIAEIKRINDSYKSIDFVGNLYAAGSYIYDNDTGNYYYGGDSQPVFSIPFGEEYVFDMEQYTNVIKTKHPVTSKSFNKEVLTWDGIEISKYSANGAQLIQDPTNPYKIKYIPNFDNIKEKGLVDEFDVALIVNKNYAAKYNSVPKYKWKIKVRQETNTPTIEYFEEYSRRDFKKSLELIDSYDKDPTTSELKIVKKVPYMTRDLREYLNPNTNKHEMSRLKFKFVVPETRAYNISYKCDDQLRVKINNLSTGETAQAEQGWYLGDWDYFKDTTTKTTRNFNWKKGDIVDFDIVGINTNGVGNYNLRIEKIDPKTNNKIEVDYFKSSLVSNIFEINEKYFGLKAVNDFLTNIKYAYKFRELDYSRLPYVNGVFLDVGVNHPDFLNKNNYDFYFQAPNVKPENAHKDDNIKNDDTIWENWNISEKTATFYLKLQEPKNIGGFVVKHRTGMWESERPTQIKVTDLTNNKNEILYDDKYGKEFNDRGKSESILNFDKEAINATIIKIEMINKDPSSNKILSLKSIKPYSQKYMNFRTSNSFAYNNPNILYSGKWEICQNDMNGYRSNMNGSYIKSNPIIENQIKFNVFSNGFTLVGPVGPRNNAVFDVYLNNKLYKSNLTNNATDFDRNASLFTYFTKTRTPEKISVKIVVKKGTLLFNYINAYGDYSILYMEEKKN